MAEKTVQVQIPVFAWREGEQVVVYTPSLELSTCGGSENEAFDNFHEAVELFFQTAEDRHVLDDLLESLGWERGVDTWTPASQPLNGGKAIPVSVPVHVS